MSCPICHDERDDGVCYLCWHNEYIELGCGCVECPNGTRIACSEKHELCSICGTQPRQAHSDTCGPCRQDDEHQQADGYRDWERMA